MGLAMPLIVTFLWGDFVLFLPEEESIYFCGFSSAVMERRASHIKRLHFRENSCVLGWNKWSKNNYSWFDWSQKTKLAIDGKPAGNSQVCRLDREFKKSQKKTVTNYFATFPQLHGCVRKSSGIKLRSRCLYFCKGKLKSVFLLDT